MSSAAIIVTADCGVAAAAIPGPGGPPCMVRPLGDSGLLAAAGSDAALSALNDAFDHPFNRNTRLDIGGFRSVAGGALRKFRRRMGASGGSEAVELAAGGLDWEGEPWLARIAYSSRFERRTECGYATVGNWPPVSDAALAALRPLGAPPLPEAAVHATLAVGASTLRTGRDADHQPETWVATGAGVCKVGPNVDPSTRGLTRPGREAALVLAAGAPLSPRAATRNGHPGCP